MVSPKTTPRESATIPKTLAPTIEELQARITTLETQLHNTQVEATRQKFLSDTVSLAVVMGLVSVGPQV